MHIILSLLSKLLPHILNPIFHIPLQLLQSNTSKTTSKNAPDQLSLSTTSNHPSNPTRNYCSSTAPSNSTASTKDLPTTSSIALAHSQISIKVSPPETYYVSSYSSMGSYNCSKKE